MPYLEKIGKQTVKDQLYQWFDVTQDPRMDGFNGWLCKQKLYEIKFYLDELLSKCPEYVGEDEWLEEQKMIRVQKILEGKK